MPSTDQQRHGTSLPDLLARCALRDEAAFAALYEATSAKLFGTALRILQNEPLAEEALQEAYVKIWRAAGTYREARGTPMTWMINIVRNQALDTVRRARYRRAEPDDALDDAPADTAGPLEDAHTRAELERLRECLARLADGPRACILMIYHQGFTPTEVARSHGWPIGTVKTWLRRGLQRLRVCMDR